MTLARLCWGSPADPPLVLLHGATTGAAEWWLMGPSLAEAGYHVVAVDLPGHGRSGSGVEPALGAIAASVVRSTTDLPRPWAAVVGQSLGALVALRLVHEIPKVTDTLVLGDPPAPDPVRKRAQPLVIGHNAQAARSAPVDLLSRIREENPHWTDAHADVMVEGLRSCDVRYIQQVLRTVDERTVEWILDSPVPALVLLADELGGSALVGPVRERLLSELPPGDTAYLGGGHMVAWERPEEFLATVVRWLATRRCGNPPSTVPRHAAPVPETGR